MNTVAESLLKRPGSLQKNPRLSQWVRVHRDGTVSIFSGKVEIGQGILTALAQIAAEELGITLGRIRMVAADTAVSPDERSEEHTSELQSQSNLVCRLLLEKKKTKQ